jgi:long-chain acyl-CoA synthetase
MEQRIWHKWYEEGIPTSLDYQERAITQYLFEATRVFPNRTAVVFENCRMSYGELEDHVRCFASALSVLGVKKGTRVAVHLPNLPQTVIAYYATLALGGEVVMTNPLYVQREIIHQWKDSNAEVAVVGDWLYQQRVGGIRDELPVRHVITTGIADYLNPPLRWLARIKLAKEGMAASVPSEPSVHDFTTLISRHRPKTDLPKIDLDSVAVLQYTGGTTGVSKGAMLTHRNLSYNVQQTAAWFPSLVPGREIWLTCLPLFHIFGMTVSMNWPVFMSGTMVLMPNPRDIPKMIKLIAKHRVTIFPALPALFNGILNHPDSKNANLTSVKGCFSGSAPLPVAILEDFEAVTGGTIVEGFGLTETSPVTQCNPLTGKRKVGSIGIPLPDTDAKIVDIDTGTREMPVGEEGELILKGPQIMPGYWNRPDETAIALRDGWLYTGDLARMDEDGYFWICGRKKDMIISSGYNIFPDEIDRILVSHPKVLEAASIGVPDAKRGESVKAFVVLKPGVPSTEEEILEFCREQLAVYKVPKAIEFRAELPKSAVQKILRRELVEEEKRKRSE